MYLYLVFTFSGEIYWCQLLFSLFWQPSILEVLDLMKLCKECPACFVIFTVAHRRSWKYLKCLYTVNTHHLVISLCAFLKNTHYRAFCFVFTRLITYLSVYTEWSSNRHKNEITVYAVGAKWGQETCGFTCMSMPPTKMALGVSLPSGSTYPFDNLMEPWPPLLDLLRSLKQGIGVNGSIR